MAPPAAANRAYRGGRYKTCSAGSRLVLYGLIVSDGRHCEQSDGSIRQVRRMGIGASDSTPRAVAAPTMISVAHRVTVAKFDHRRLTLNPETRSTEDGVLSPARYFGRGTGCGG